MSPKQAPIPNEDEASDAESVVCSIVGSTKSTSSTEGHMNGYTPVSWYRFLLRTIILLLLPLLSAAGLYGTFVLGDRNGTFKQLVSLVESDAPLLPGSMEPLLTSYTGLKAVDKQLSILVAFFAPMVDFSQANLTLFSIFGFGQFGAVWALMVMESFRMGNKGRVVSYVGTVGMIFQNISYTVTTPFWLFLHLLTSPVAKPFPGTHANSVLLVPTLDLRLIPLSVTIGYTVPAILMALPYPSQVTPRTHQIFVAIWQAFPAWTIIAHFLLRTVFQKLGKMISSEEGKKKVAKPLGASYLRNAKHVYRFVLFMCISTHIPTLFFTLAPSSIIPASYKTLQRLSSENIFSVYIPYLPLPAYQVLNLAEGVHNFLVWDLYIGSVGFVLWAVLLHRNATMEKGIVDPNTSLPIYRELLSGERGRGGVSGSSLLAKIVGWSLVGGPVAAVAILLWGRDAIVRQKIKQGI